MGGWRPEPVDTRDVPASQLLTALAADSTLTHVDLRPNCSPVENQRNVGSCVGNATVGALELLENLRGDAYVDLSRLFVYYNARAAMGEETQDNGSFIRDAFMSLSVLGVCPEELWTYDTAKVFIRPAWKAYKAAYGHRINKFYKIFSTGEDRIAEIESALRAKCPVVFGASVYEAYRTCTGKVAMPSGASIGGHAQCIVGFDSVARYFIVRNSWGTSWGDGGYAYMPYEYLDAADANDFWVAT